MITTHSRLTRLPEVLAFFCISRSNLYQKIDRGLFPKPFKLGARAIAWLDSENEQILAALIAGQSQEEIKQLVKTIEESRKQFKGVA